MRALPVLLLLSISAALAAQRGHSAPELRPGWESIVSAPLSATSVTPDFEPDVAWDETARRYLMVWPLLRATGVEEIRGVLLDENGAAVSSVLRINYQSLSELRKPRVTNVGVSGCFLVVWERRSSSGNWEIEGCSVRASEGIQSSFADFASSSVGCVEADLSGSFGDEVTLVWRQPGQGIRLRRIVVPPFGKPMASGPVRVLAQGSSLARPAISRGSGGSGSHLVAWQTSGIFGTAIEAIVVDDNQTQLSGVIRISASLTQRSPQRRAPAVDGDGQSYVVAYERQEVSYSAEYDVYCRGLTWDGINLMPAGGEVALATDPGSDESAPAVGMVDSRFLVAWAQAQPGSSSYDVMMRTVDAGGQACGPLSGVPPSLTASDVHPAIGAQRASGGGGGEGMVAYASTDTQGNQFALTHVVEQFTGASTQITGPGCGLGGTISVTGPFAIGNLDFRVDLTGADPATGPLFLSLGAPGATFPCGGCTLVNPLVAVPVPSNNGNASLPLPVPCGIPPVPFVFEFQWVAFGSWVSACQAVPILSVSDRLQATLGF